MHTLHFPLSTWCTCTHTHTLCIQSSTADEPTDKDNEVTELPEEMNVVGIDDNIHTKSLQTAICEVSYRSQ